MTDIFIGVLGVLLVVGLAYLLFRNPPPAICAEEAIRAADSGIPGFRGVDAICGTGGRAALVVDAANRIAIVHPHGDHYSVRLAGPGGRIRRAGSILLIRTRERMFPEVRLDAGDAAEAWFNRLRTAFDEPS